MNSVLEEIKKLRDNPKINIDFRNNNRYRLLIRENDGSHTSYCFSTPIYNQKSQRLITPYFQSDKQFPSLVGSNANITVADDVRMENNDGFCLIKLKTKNLRNKRSMILLPNATLLPTTNGIAIKADIREAGFFTFDIEVSQPFMNIRANDKSFSLMKEKLRPFVTFSCIGTLDEKGALIAPAKIGFQKITDRKYRLVVFSASPFGAHILLEGNMYERKLFLDTTVESRNPNTNNAFGSTGFVGYSDLFGQQWLYSRFEESRLSQLMGRKINHVILHIPQYNEKKLTLRAYRVAARFCSFGSNWNNKMQSGVSVSESYFENGYQHLDLTSMVVDAESKHLQKTEGFILKPKENGIGFAAIATGDSFLSPQILEINHK